MRRLLTALLCVSLTACTTSKPETTKADTASTAAPSTQPAHTPKDPTVPASSDLSTYNTTFATRYAQHDITAALDHYHPETTWFFTNGAHKDSRVEIQSALEALHTSGAGSFAFSAHTHTPLKQGHVTTDAFAFEPVPGKRVSGTRYAFWSDESKVLTDLWVPGSDVDEATDTDVRAYLHTLSQAYTSDNAEVLTSLYTHDATLVLSDGKKFDGAATASMLQKVTKMGVTSMTITPLEIHQASPDHVYILSTQSFTLSGPDGPMTLKARALRLLERDAQTWHTRVELAWPDA